MLFVAYAWCSEFTISTLREQSSCRHDLNNDLPVRKIDKIQLPIAAYFGRFKAFNKQTPYYT